jgi:hypothetical protein
MITGQVPAQAVTSSRHGTDGMLASIDPRCVDYVHAVQAYGMLRASLNLSKQHRLVGACYLEAKTHFGLFICDYLKMLAYMHVPCWAVQEACRYPSATAAWLLSVPHATF